MAECRYLCKSFSYSDDLIKIGHIDGDGIELFKKKASKSYDFKVSVKRLTSNMKFRFAFECLNLGFQSLNSIAND